MKKSIFNLKAIALLAVFVSTISVVLAFSQDYSIESSDVGETYGVTVNFETGSELRTITANGNFSYSSSNSNPVSVTINGNTVYCGSSATFALASSTVIDVEVAATNGGSGSYNLGGAWGGSQGNVKIQRHKFVE